MEDIHYRMGSIGFTMVVDNSLFALYTNASRVTGCLYVRPGEEPIVRKGDCGEPFIIAGYMEQPEDKQFPLFGNQSESILVRELSNGTVAYVYREHDQLWCMHVTWDNS